MSGDTLTVSGTNFSKDALVTLTWDGGTSGMATAVTRPNGDFSTLIVIPSAAAGKHVLEASGGGASASTIVQVIGSAPAGDATATPTQAPTASIPTSIPTQTPAPTSTPSLPASCSTGQFLAEYFNNQTLGGTPVYTACTASISYDWGMGSPGNGISTDNFSVRWTGSFTFAGGLYTFTARTDDGIRVWLDGNLLVDAWKDQSATTYVVNANVPTGVHLMRVEYYENNGTATAQVSWQFAPTPIPATPTATIAPPTATAVPPTAVPPTAVPPTAVPPTAVPPTAVPPAPTPVSTSGSTASPSFDFSGEEAQLVDLINQSRAANGIAPVSMEARVMRVAHWRAQDMSNRNYSDHLIPAGACYTNTQGATTCWDHDIYVWDVLATEGIGGYVGENFWLAPNLGDQQAEVSNQVFYDHPGHHENMLDPTWHYEGNGMAYTAWYNGVNVVEVFCQFNS